MKETLKVGDVVTNWGLNFEKLKWWEYMTFKPRWIFSDLKYWFKRQYQRIRYGFPLEESWDFYSYCAKWSLPRLKKFRENTMSYPSKGEVTYDCNQLTFNFLNDIPINDDGFEKWKATLDKIIWSMEHHADEINPIYPEEYDPRHIVLEVSPTGTKFGNVDKRPLDYTPVFDHQKRLNEGFELFGKHFSNLWD